MTMSIAPPSVSPPTTEVRPNATSGRGTDARALAVASTSDQGASGGSRSAAPRATNNEIAFDSQSGLMVVRTVDLSNGEMIAQNPTEAYLRLAHAMNAAVRADREGGGAVASAGADLVA